MTTPLDRDQQVGELRAALQHAVRLLSFSAGRAAGTDPAHAESLLAAAEKLEATLART
ncbi:hypothetical protein [Streptomyces sp. NPDC060198]|uniref:hypothetical protein n=1 Tax=Streptomyces sp. NPDC060198 TaxID=3347070 RepID=UPI0036676153